MEPKSAEKRTEEKKECGISKPNRTNSW